MGVEGQFDTFVHITEKYLQPTSSQEVNISGQMQSKIASLQDKETFSALNEGSRRDVLQEPLKEVVRVLEQNLLANFKQSPEMLTWRENVKLQNLRESLCTVTPMFYLAISDTFRLQGCGFGYLWWKRQTATS